MTAQTPKTLTDLREIAFSTIEALRQGSMDLELANVTNRLLNTVIAMAKVEIENRKLSAETKLSEGFFPTLEPFKSVNVDNDEKAKQMIQTTTGLKIVEQLNSAATLTTHRLR